MSRLSNVPEWTIARLQRCLLILLLLAFLAFFIGVALYPLYTFGFRAWMG